MDDFHVGLLSQNASTPDEALAKVKTEEGFGLALYLISRVSSRKEINYGEDAVGQGKERGQRKYVENISRGLGFGGRQERPTEEGGDDYRSAPNSYGN